jgi:hypothetical protein
MDYHRIDLFSLGWSKSPKLPSLNYFSLVSLCRHFQIELEPEPHRAVNGAKKLLEVMKKLREI